MRPALDVQPRPAYKPAWLSPTSWLRAGSIRAAHVAMIVLICAATWPQHYGVFWAAAVGYYYGLYARMITFCLWTRSSLDLIARTLTTAPRERLEESEPDITRWPRFLLLIPGYRSASSMPAVGTILANQDYPRQLWRAVFISDQHEEDEVTDQNRQIAGDLYRAVDHRQLPRDMPVSDAALTLFLADDGRASSLVYLRLFMPNDKRLVVAWGQMLLSLVLRGRALESTLAPDIRGLVEGIAGRAMDLASRNSDGIMQTTGCRIDDPYRLGPSSRLAASLAHEELRRTRTGRQLCSRLLEPAAASGDWKEECTALRERVLGDGALRERIQELCITANPSTGAAMQTRLAELGHPGLYHFLRPPLGRAKPAALNAGLEYAVQRSWLQDENTSVVVLDSDSMLHRSALAVAAHEILCDPEPNVIRQCLPITTLNFNFRNWLVKGIIACDAMGAPGRWARSVRTQSRADLTAGSGVVIPFSLLRYLRDTYGEAWDSGVICEDARMIISQYSILDGASKRTKMIPAFVLEAAPESSQGVLKTYGVFWRQRLRWAFGGMDEVAALWHVSLNRLLVSSTDFRPMEGTIPQKARAIGRKNRLLFLWLADHLWWGATALAPVLWIAAELLCRPSHSPVYAGVCILSFALPLWLLLVVFKRNVVPLIPGGIARNPKWVLVQTYCWMCMASSFYVWPVVAAQMACLLHVRWLFKRYAIRRHLTSGSGPPAPDTIRQPATNKPDC